MDIRVGPDKDVVDGEEDGEEGDGENVDSDGEESSNFLLVIQCLNVFYKHVLLVQLPEETTTLCLENIKNITIDFDGLYGNY